MCIRDRSRYYHAALEYKANIIVRITADCPLVDPELVTKLIKKFKSSNYDYVSNIDPPTYPDGLDVEVYSFTALKRAFKESKLPVDREHISPYIFKNKNFKKYNTVVLGMSADSVKAQKNFCSKQEFPFQLLSDPEKETIRAYEAIGLKKMYGREYEGILRVAYLIDENGKVVDAHYCKDTVDHLPIDRLISFSKGE